MIAAPGPRHPLPSVPRIRSAPEDGREPSHDSRKIESSKKTFAPLPSRWKETEADSSFGSAARRLSLILVL